MTPARKPKIEDSVFHVTDTSDTSDLSLSGGQGCSSENPKVSLPVSPPWEAPKNEETACSHTMGSTEKRGYRLFSGTY